LRSRQEKDVKNSNIRETPTVEKIPGKIVRKSEMTLSSRRTLVDVLYGVCKTTTEI